MLQRPNIIRWVPWLVRVLMLGRYLINLFVPAHASDIQKPFHSSTSNCLFDNEIIKHCTHPRVVMVTNVDQKPSPPSGGSRNFYWGVQNLVQKGRLSILWHISFHRDDHVFLNL